MFINKSFPIFIAIISFLSISCENQEIKQKTESLKNIVIPVNSIDPANEDFSDLQFLKKIIEKDSIRVVMLGEQTHGDGSTFLAKSRLIKFLHKEMGFDVLVFESGLYDCTKAWERIEKYGNYEDAIKKAVFPMWVKSQECQELIKYLQSALTTSTPLELTGFDSQLTGDKPCQYFLEDFDSLKLTILTQAEKNLFVKIVCSEDEVYSDDKNSDCVKLLDKICQHFDSLTTINNDLNTELWRNVLYGVRVTYTGMYNYKKFPENTKKLFKEQGLRDTQMGNNLIWLSDKKYKDQKIIVWAASFHNSRNIKELKISRDSSIYDQTTTMGDIVYKTLGRKMYSIMFSAYQGSYRNMSVGKSESITKPSDGSIEDIMNRLKYKYAYIDLRNQNNPAWLKSEFSSRSLGFMEMSGKWSDVADGIFYIEEMRPSTFGDEGTDN